MKRRQSTSLFDEPPAEEVGKIRGFNVSLVKYLCGCSEINCAICGFIGPKKPPSDGLRIAGVLYPIRPGLAEED